MHSLVHYASDHLVLSNANFCLCRLYNFIHNFVRMRRYCGTILQSLSFFESGRFTLRSRIQLITKADGQSQFVFLDKNIISVEDISDFKNLLVENDFYQIKLQAVSGNASGPMVLSSIPSVRKECIPSN